MLPIKVGMVSLGCPKNQVDAEMMLSSLDQSGFVITNDAAAADVVIINTCGFIESAKQESIETILEYTALKEWGSLKAIIATGCLAERYRDEVIKEIPELDAVIGIGANAAIADIIKKVMGGQTVTSFPSKDLQPMNGDRILTTPKYSAYLRVADGCNNRCTFCAIPLIRGVFKSRPMEDVLQEADKLAKQGVRELIVIAQDTSRYGQDLYGRLKLPALLQALCRIEGVEWVRLLYCYPDTVTDELLTVIADEPKIVKYIDMPLQHASGEILSAMNRRGNRESLMALVQKIRNRIQDVVIRTTLIVGFPGETEEAFYELCQFVKDCKFERLGCFMYSPEEGTVASKMENQVEEGIKAYRFDIVMIEAARIMEQVCTAQNGTVLKVLTEGYDSQSGYWFGRSYADAPDVDCKVLFKAAQAVSTGHFYDIKITGLEDCDLVGELVSLDD